LGKLTFVGLGLGAKGITLEGMEAIKEADVAFLEYYTTPHEATLLEEIEKSTGKVLTVVDRGFVEDGKTILAEAQKSSVVLAVPGDPMIATTHNDLRTRAIRSGIETLIVHAATIASSAASASGLHYYKFGGTITVTRENVNVLHQVYQTLHRNLLFGLHTLLLLEVDVESNESVTPNGAIQGLLQAERNFKRAVIADDTFGIVLSRVGRVDFEVRAGSFSELQRWEFGEHPHCLIIPGKLHFTEVEAVRSIFSVGEEEIGDNAEEIRRNAELLIPRYAEKTRKTLASVRGHLGPDYGSLVENVEAYISDAERFLTDGEDELAMLNMGYAEGLLDALGLTGKIKIDW